MPKLTKRLPSLRRHASGQGIVTIQYHDHYCGRWGTPECTARYNQVVARYLSGDRQTVGDEHAITVAEVVVYMNRYVAAMVQLQLRTGMRPGEDLL